MDTTTNRPSRQAGTTSARRLITRCAPAQLRPVMLATSLAAGTVAADSRASNSLGLVAWDEPSLSFTCDDVTTEEINLPLFTQFFGSMAAFAVSAVLRLGGGEPLLGLPALLPYPQGFPFRTVAAMAGLVLLPVVARLTARRDPPRPLARESAHS